MILVLRRQAPHAGAVDAAEGVAGAHLGMYVCMYVCIYIYIYM